MENTKHLLATGCLKSKEKVLSNGNMFLQKKNQPILGGEVVRYVSLIIDGGKVQNDCKIKYNSLNNKTLKIASSLI